MANIHLLWHHEHGAKGLDLITAFETREVMGNLRRSNVHRARGVNFQAGMLFEPNSEGRRVRRPQILLHSDCMKSMNTRSPYPRLAIISRCGDDHEREKIDEQYDGAHPSKGQEHAYRST